MLCTCSRKLSVLRYVAGASAELDHPWRIAAVHEHPTQIACFFSYEINHEWLRISILAIEPMTSRQYILLASFILAAFVLAVRSVDRKKFKSCMTSAFCRRYRSWKDLPERPSLTVAQVGRPSDSDDGPTTGVELLLKSSAELTPNYAAELSLYRSESIIRLRIDDADPTPRRVRYRVPHGDVVVDQPAPASGTLSEVLSSFEKGVTTLRVGDRYRVEIVHDPFTLRVFNKDGVLVQVVNARNFFTFERYRQNRQEQCPPNTAVDMACHPSIDQSESWDERFRAFTDKKQFGPSAVGIDVQFFNAVGVFGLPEHTTGFNLPVFLEGSPREAGNPNDEPPFAEYRFFNSDVFEHEVGSKMAIYGAIPLLTGIHKRTPDTAAAVSALLWLNPSETFVALTQQVDCKHVESTWVSETGIMDIFIFVGPDPQSVISQYHYITGLPAMAPVFAVGYHQSRWAYPNEQAVEEVNQQFDQKDVSCDFIWLDIQHTEGNRYMTWNNANYAHPIELTKKLVASGRRLVAIIDPHVKVHAGYHVYAGALKEKLFITKPDGSDFVGNCWPGDSSYVDFIRTDAREYWQGLLQFSAYSGSSPDLFVWNDMNEPSVFNGPETGMPRGNMHGNGTIEHREIHNAYGMYYHRTTFEGLLARESPAKRPFVLTRSFFAGSHRFGPTWTGDNRATWEFLKVSVPMILSLAVSGMSFAGADVGGFEGDPGPELFTRWHQLAAMAYPFYRGHTHIESGPKEPWSLGTEVLDRVRTAIDIRYSLLPYVYTAFAQAALYATPIVRPLWFDHLTDASTFTDVIATEEELMLGASILVRGVFAPGVSSVDVYLPDQDALWYNFHDRSAAPVAGGTRQTVPVDMASIPVYVKGGSIIPMKLKKRPSTKLMIDDPISLTVWFNKTKSGSGLIYVDDGESMEYSASADFALIRVDYSDKRLQFSRVAGNRHIQDLVIDRVEFVGSDVPAITNPMTINLPDSVDMPFSFEEL